MIHTILASILALQDISDPEYLDTIVTIRGFPQQLPNGEWVLSNLPNARSCCEGQGHPKLVIDGEFSSIPTSKVVTLEGKLVHKDGRYLLEIN